MIRLEATSAGVVLPVRAQPGARVNAIRGEQGGSLKVAVTQVPEKGKATQAVIKTLCEALDLRASQVALLQGETSRQKRFLIRDISVDDLARRLAAALAEH